jgi:uracil-DNA glycosylase family 4
MSDRTNDILGVLANIETFLKQEKELFGDLLFRSGIEEKRTELMAQRKPKSVPAVHESVDLFGGSTKPTSSGSPSTSPTAQSYPSEPWTSSPSIDELNQHICECLKCPLGSTRIKFVFGVGSPHADIVVVGEAPGADEDAKGEPFVGRAGQLLNKILEAIQFKREEVFICNILKCRPPNNRDPLPEEIESCEPYLWKQLELIKPKMILCLGRIAGQSLLKTNETLGSMRGRFHDYRGIKLMVTYHPAALLRNPNWKKPTWEDVQLFRKEYDRMKSIS